MPTGTHTGWFISVPLCSGQSELASVCPFVFLSFCLFVFLSFCLFVFLSNLIISLMYNIKKLYFKAQVQSLKTISIKLDKKV